MLTERFVAAGCGIDDSWGILGGALQREYERLTPELAAGSVDAEVRLTLLRRLLDAWLADEYGYLDLIPRLFPSFVSGATEAAVLVVELGEIADAYAREARVLEEQGSDPSRWDIETSRARTRRDLNARMATEIRLRYLDADEVLE